MCASSTREARKYYKINTSRYPNLSKIEHTIKQRIQGHVLQCPTLIRSRKPQDI